MVYTSIDEWSEKKMFDKGIIKWLSNHEELVWEWLDDNTAEIEDETAMATRILLAKDKFLSYVFYLYLKQKEEMTEQERHNYLIDRFLAHQGELCMVVGPRRSGKTTFAYNIAEALVNREESIWWFGPPTKLPPFISGRTLDFDKIPPNTTTILDEASMQFFNRISGATQKDIIKKLSVISHSGRGFLVLTQCLPKWQKIQTEKGIKKISEIKPFERILSYDFKTGNIVKSLAFPSNRTLKQKYIITFTDDTKIECSEEHKWFVYMNNGINVKKAKELKVNDIICSVANSKRIKKIQKLKCNEEMTDLYVPKFHNFILSNGVISHNSASIIDINFLRQASSLIFTAKQKFQLTSERLIFNKYINYFMPNKIGEALYFDGDSLLELKFPIPEWWSNEYSTPYRHFRSEAEAYRFILECLKDTNSIKTIADYLEMRGWKKIDEIGIEFIAELCRNYGIAYLESLKDHELVELINSGYDDTPINDIIKGKQYRPTYEWTQDEFQREEWKREIENNPLLLNILRTNKNQLMLKYIKSLKEHDHLIASIYGLTGSGKSLAAISLSEVIGEILGKPFTSESIAMTMEEALRIISNMKRYETLILDEQPSRYGLGSGAEEMQLRTIEETCRAAQINFIFNGPKLKSHLNRFILKPWGIDKKAQVTKLILYTPNLQPIGYITLRRPTAINEKKYLKKKLQFVSQAKRGEISSTATSMAEKAKELLKDKMFMSLPSRNAKCAYIIEKYKLTHMSAIMLLGHIDVALAKLNHKSKK